MKIALLTLGCKLNYAETSTYERGFKAAGLEVTDWRDTSADVYLIRKQLTLCSQKKKDITLQHSRSQQVKLQEELYSTDTQMQHGTGQ